MKIRIQGNSIRLRLKKEEVAELAKNGMVEDRLMFGPDPASQHLVYRLAASEISEMNTYFSHGAVVVEIPSEQVHAWADSETVGFEHEVIVDGSATIRVLVEKDFKCLTVRKGEDETDLFPNPNEKHGG